MKETMLVVMLAVLGCWAFPANANTYTIGFVYAADGSVSALLNATVTPCSAIPSGIASITRNGSQINIDSVFAIPPPGCPLAPGATKTFQIAAALGKLQNGEYSVLWTAGGGQVQIAQASLRVVAGAFPRVAASIPTLDTMHVVLLVALLVAAIAFTPHCSRNERRAP